MAIVRAAVIKRGRKDFLVRPSVLFLEGGDRLRFLNFTGYPLALSAVKGSHAGPKQKLNSLLQLTRRTPALIVKKGDHTEVTVPVLEPLKRSGQNMLCRYRVEVHIGKGVAVEAKGDSDPVVIIDNP